MTDRSESGMSRRRFVRESGLMTAGAVLGGGALSSSAEDAAARTTSLPPSDLPRAVLGRTGESITRMCLGTVACGMAKGAMPRDVADVIDAALEAGIRAVDVAPAYIKAEEGAGLALGKRRKEVLLSTKVRCDTVEDAEKSLANSLRLLKTDWIDTLYLHSVGSRGIDRDPDVVLRPGSVFPWLLKQKKLGKCRFIGVSSHNAPSMCKQVLDTGEVDVLLTVINFVDRHTYNHEGELLPVAKKHGTGVIAMKVFGGGKRLVPPGVERSMAGPTEMDERYIEAAIRYAMGVPGVAALDIGCHSAEHVRQNVATIKNYKPLTEKEREVLDCIGRQLAPKWKERFGPAERPKQQHT